jgi:hypothetical protein
MEREKLLYLKRFYYIMVMMKEKAKLDKSFMINVKFCFKNNGAKK